MRGSKFYIAVAVFFWCCSEACAYTTEHHLVNMSRDLANMIGAPVKAIFIQGPGDVKRMYNYEVKEREKPENRHGLLRKVYAIVSAPIVETKAVVDGATSCVAYGGKFISEFLSIFFCD